jgi:hypothetical protein
MIFTLLFPPHGRFTLCISPSKAIIIARGVSSLPGQEREMNSAPAASASVGGYARVIDDPQIAIAYSRFEALKNNCDKAGEHLKELQDQFDRTEMLQGLPRKKLFEAVPHLYENTKEYAEEDAEHLKDMMMIGAWAAGALATAIVGGIVPGMLVKGLVAAGSFLGGFLIARPLFEVSKRWIIPHQTEKFLRNRIQNERHFLDGDIKMARCIYCDAQERYLEGKRLVDEKTADALKRIPQIAPCTTSDDDYPGFIIIDGIRLEKKS